MDNIDDKVFFVCIGGQRCGTNRLYRILSRHHEIAFPPVKELHFFDQKHLPEICGYFYSKKVDEAEHRFDKVIDELLDRAEDGSRIYADDFNLDGIHHVRRLADLFSVLTITNTDSYTDYMYDLAVGKKAFGEITPSYSMLDEDGFEDICTVHDNIRFLFLLRDPLTRFWSALKHQERVAPHEHPIKNFAKAIEEPFYELRSDYKRTIEALKAVTPRETIVALFYEEMVTPDTFPKVTGTLERALGVEGLGEWNDELGEDVGGDASGVMPEGLPKAFLDRYRYVYDYVRQEMGYLPEAWEQSLALLG